MYIVFCFGGCYEQGFYERSGRQACRNQTDGFEGIYTFNFTGLYQIVFQSDYMPLIFLRVPYLSD